jgi:hypothetical protein
VAAFSSAIKDEHILELVTLIGTLREWKVQLNPSSSSAATDSKPGIPTMLTEFGADLVLNDPFEVGEYSSYNSQIT